MNNVNGVRIAVTGDIPLNIANDLDRDKMAIKLLRVGRILIRKLKSLIS